MALPVGSIAPDFDLVSQSGETVRLSELTEEGVVVVFFYPRDGTPGCTAEACAFRDRYEVFREAGAEVVGISSDSAQSHRDFADEQRLGFPLLADPGDEIRRRYGVKDTVPLLVPGRDTFVIDSARVIRHHFSSQLRPTAHVDEALSIVRKLASR